MKTLSGLNLGLMIVSYGNKFNVMANGIFAAIASYFICLKWVVLPLKKAAKPIKLFTFPLVLMLQVNPCTLRTKNC